MSSTIYAGTVIGAGQHHDFNIPKFMLIPKKQGEAGSRQTADAVS